MKLKIIILIAMLSVKATAHEAASGWEYPPHCCTGKDCEQLSDDRVIIFNNGYMVYGKHFIPFDEPDQWNNLPKPSGDDHFHACWSPIEVERQYGPRCFFYPRQLTT